MLILIWLAFGCAKPAPRPSAVAPEQARAIICKEGNERQKAQWNMVVTLAEQHPMQLGAGVRWVGGHLARCGFAD